MIIFKEIARRRWRPPTSDVEMDYPCMSAHDAMDGSSTGIAMCHIAVAVAEWQMSLLGTKQTFQPVRLMSALPPKAEINSAVQKVCFGP